MLSIEPKIWWRCSFQTLSTSQLPSFPLKTRWFFITSISYAHHQSEFPVVKAHCIQWKDKHSGEMGKTRCFCCLYRHSEELHHAAKWWMNDKPEMMRFLRIKLFRYTRILFCWYLSSPHPPLLIFTRVSVATFSRIAMFSTYCSRISFVRQYLLNGK